MSHYPNKINCIILNKIINFMSLIIKKFRYIDYTVTFKRTSLCKSFVCVDIPHFPM